MKVKKLFKDCGLAYNHVVQLCDGRFARFLMVPFRKISEKDLTILPNYRAVGVRAEEAEDYMYRSYGLEKENGAFRD